MNKHIFFFFGMEVPLVEFMHLVFTRMPGESHCTWLRSLLLCLCDDFQALINSLVCWLCRGALGLFLFQTVSCLLFRLWLGRVSRTRILPEREQEKKLYFNTNQAYRVKFTLVPRYSSAGRCQENVHTINRINCCSITITNYANLHQTASLLPNYIKTCTSPLNLDLVHNVL